MVVVPTLLGRPEDVPDLLEALEIRYLGNRDPNLFFALLTDFRDAPERTQPGDDELVGLARAGIEALNEHVRRGPPGHLLSVPPAEGVESARSGVDGLGAQAGQARAVQRPSAGVPAGSGRGRRGADAGGAAAASAGAPPMRPRLLRHRRRSLHPRVDQVRHHPRHRHAAPPRRRAHADRQHGPSAQSPGVRREEGPRRRRLRDPAAAGLHQSRQQHAAPGSRACSPAKRASTPTRGRSPTSTRTSSARARSSARASTTWRPSLRPSAGASRRTSSSATTSSRAATPARLWWPMSTSSRSTPPPTPWRPAGGTAGRGATGSWPAGCCRACPGPVGSGSRTRCRCSPSGSCSTTCAAASCRRRSSPCAWADGCSAVGPSWLWPLLTAGALFLPPLVTAAIEFVRKPAEREWLLHLVLTGKSLVQPLLRALLGLMLLPYDALVYLDAILRSAVSMLVTRRGLLIWYLPSYGRRNARRSSGRVLRRDVDRPRPGRGAGRGADRRARHPVGRLAVRRPPSGALAGVAPRRLVDQQAGQAGRGGVEPSAAGVPARACPADLAVLRRFRRPRRQLAAAGQLSGVSVVHDRLAHLPHQHGHGAAREPGGARFRLHLHRRAAAPDRADSADDGEARTLPRSFLQLVRHPHAAAAQPPVRLFGRQRQPRRQPADSPRGARRAEEQAGARPPRL